MGESILSAALTLHIHASSSQHTTHLSTPPLTRYIHPYAHSNLASTRGSGSPYKRANAPWIFALIVASYFALKVRLTTAKHVRISTVLPLRSRPHCRLPCPRSLVHKSDPTNRPTRHTPPHTKD